MQNGALTMTRLDQAPATDDSGVISFDTTLQNGPEAGPVFVALQAFDIPVGCEVWFQNTDGDIPIALQPTVVSMPNLTMGIQVTLPANYTCTIRSYLRLNGQQLPTDANLSLTVSQIIQLGSATLQQ
jgi:hypothetical protein